MEGRIQVFPFYKSEVSVMADGCDNSNITLDYDTDTVPSIIHPIFVSEINERNREV